MRTWDKIVKPLQPYAPGKKTVPLTTTDTTTPRMKNYDLRTKQGRDREVLDEIRTHGGFSAFWVSANMGRAHSLNRLLKSGRVTATPKVFPWTDARIN